MRELMFQVYPDVYRLWHWVVFNEDLQQTVESPRAFESRDEASWDARRYIGVPH